MQLQTKTMAKMKTLGLNRPSKPSPLCDSSKASKAGSYCLDAVLTSSGLRTYLSTRQLIADKLVSGVVGSGLCTRQTYSSSSASPSHTSSISCPGSSVKSSPSSTSMRGCLSISSSSWAISYSKILWSVSGMRHIAHTLHGLARVPAQYQRLAASTPPSSLLRTGAQSLRRLHLIVEACFRLSCVTPG